MILTSKMLYNQLSEYGAPRNKVQRMVKAGEVMPIVKGLYETDPSVPAHLLAASIYGPSYISFEYALSAHGLIPERVSVVTSATFEKGKRKRYSTPFGTFSYQDVPSKAFPLGVEIIQEGNYYYRMARAEKALCDKLYTLSPVSNITQFEALLFEDMRIDKSAFDILDKQFIEELEDKYKSTNVKKLCAYLRKRG